MKPNLQLCEHESPDDARHCRCPIIGEVFETLQHKSDCRVENQLMLELKSNKLTVCNTNQLCCPQSACEHSRLNLIQFCQIAHIWTVLALLLIYLWFKCLSLCFDF